MRPVMMTSFGWPDGNCFAACMASIFEVPLSDLPDGGAGIKPLVSGEAVDAWLAPWNEWLGRRGLAFAACEAWMPEVDGAQSMWKVPGYSVLNCAVLGAPLNADGTELRHCVVAFDGKIVHDPQTGDLSRLHQIWPSYFQYFIVLDPTKIAFTGAKP